MTQKNNSDGIQQYCIKPGQEAYLQEALSRFCEVMERREKRDSLPIMTHVVLFSDGSGHVILPADEDYFNDGLQRKFTFDTIRELLEWME